MDARKKISERASKESARAFPESEKPFLPLSREREKLFECSLVIRAKRITRDEAAAGGRVATVSVLRHSSRSSSPGVSSASGPDIGTDTGDMSTKFIIDSMLPAKYQQFHPQQLFSSATPGTIQACTTSPATASLESSLSAAAVAAAAVNYAQQHNSPSPTGSSPQHSGSSASTSPAARTTSSMYPYVSAAAAHHHHQQQQAVAAAAFGATSSMVPGFGSTAASSAALAAAAAVDAATAGDKSCRYTASLTGNVAPASADPMVNYTLGHHHQNGATPGSLVSSASASSAVSAASASMAAAAQFYHQAAAASAVVDPLTSCQQPTTGQPGISDIPRYPWMSITGESFLCVVKFHIFTFFAF